MYRRELVADNYDNAYTLTLVKFNEGKARKLSISRQWVLVFGLQFIFSIWNHPVDAYKFEIKRVPETKYTCYTSPELLTDFTIQYLQKILIDSSSSEVNSVLRA